MDFANFCLSSEFGIFSPDLLAERVKYTALELDAFHEGVLLLDVLALGEDLLEYLGALENTLAGLLIGLGNFLLAITVRQALPQLVQAFQSNRQSGRELVS